MSLKEGQPMILKDVKQAFDNAAKSVGLLGSEFNKAGKSAASLISVKVAKQQDRRDQLQEELGLKSHCAEIKLQRFTAEGTDLVERAWYLRPGIMSTAPESRLLTVWHPEKGLWFISASVDPKSLAGFSATFARDGVEISTLCTPSHKASREIESIGLNLLMQERSSVHQALGLWTGGVTMIPRVQMPPGRVMGTQCIR